MIQGLNPIRPKLFLDGDELLFESMVLEQELNSCHHFDVMKEYPSQDELWQEAHLWLTDRIGSSVLIRLEHLDSSSSYEFSGVVTDVRVETWDSTSEMSNRRVNRLHLIGSGDPIRLDGAKGRDSFVDCQLRDVFLQLTDGAGFEVVCEPRYRGVLPYLMRYDESVFSFMNRLSSLFGEWFYYDGRVLRFGESDEEKVESLCLDRDVLNLRTVAKAKPYKTSFYDYYYEDDAFIMKDSSEDSSSTEDIRKRVDLIFSEKGLSESDASLYSSDDLKDMADVRQQALAGSMYTVEGESLTCRVRIGGLVDISFPHKMQHPPLERFRIISVSHKIDKNGNYRNHFVAIPEGGLSVPLELSKRVKAYPEIAVVLDNADPLNLGRVLVQFDWQKPVWKSTNWIRVVSPDAGGSDEISQNRGLLFIPEVGDQVMVGFEYGDPNRPYVIGSLFSGGTAAGGGMDNAHKSITTRSGHKISFNDDMSTDWGIRIEDKNGNMIQLDTSGRSISVSSIGSISLLSHDISIDATNAISISAGGSSIFNSEKDMRFVSAEELAMSARKIQVDSTEKEAHQSDSFLLESESEIAIHSKKVEVDSSDENLVLATGGDVDVQSKGKVNLF